MLNHIHFLTPRNSDYVSLDVKRNLVNMIKLRILRFILS